MARSRALQRILLLIFGVLALDATRAGEPVARIMGREIALEEISPPAKQVKTERAKASDAAFAKWLFEYRHGRLAAMIWQPLKKDFCKTHDCKAADKEIDEFHEALSRAEKESEREWRQRLVEIKEELRGNSLPEKKRDELDAEKQVLEKNLASIARETAEKENPDERKAEGSVERQFVEAWKLNRALYREYGGRVIFQQAGIEPIDAYRQFLQEHEKKGAFEILDPALRQEFWKYFTTMPHTYIDGDDADFETPWWKKKRAEP